MKKILAMLLAAALCMTMSAFAETVDTTSDTDDSAAVNDPSIIESAKAALAELEAKGEPITVGESGITLNVPLDMQPVTDGIEEGAVRYANAQLTVTAILRSETADALIGAIPVSEILSNEVKDVNDISYTVITKADGSTVAFTAIEDGTLEITLAAADGADVSDAQEQILGSVKTSAEQNA